MLIAQITDTHIKLPGKLAYRKVDTAAMLERCVAELQALKQQPDLILLTGDLVDLGRPEEYDHLKAILSPLQQRIIATEGDDSLLRRAIGSDWKGKLSPAAYALAIVLAFVSQWIAVTIYVLVALMWLVPDRRIERALSAPEI